MIMRLPNLYGLKVIQNLIAEPAMAKWIPRLNIIQFEAGCTDEKLILSSLENNETTEETLSALVGTATYERPISRRVMMKVKKLTTSVSPATVIDLALLEGARLDKGENPELCDFLLEQANILWTQIKKEKNHTSFDHSKRTLMVIFDTLGSAKWTPTKKLLLQILSHKAPLHNDLLESAITLAGYVFWKEFDEAILLKLESFLFDADSLHGFSAALSLGRIDLDRLYRYQGAQHVIEALEQISAEKGYFIFEKFWTDNNGRITTWKNPPVKILFAYDSDYPDIPQIFSHEMSRWGYCEESNDPDACHAYLIFQPLDPYATDLAEQARRLSASGLNKKIFIIEKGLSEDQARLKAKTIGQSLVS